MTIYIWLLSKVAKTATVEITLQRRNAESCVFVLQVTRQDYITATPFGLWA